MAEPLPILSAELDASYLSGAPADIVPDLERDLWLAILSAEPGGLRDA